MRTEKKTSYFPKYFAKIDYLSHDRCAQLIDSFFCAVNGGLVRVGEANNGNSCRYRLVGAVRHGRLRELTAFRAVNGDLAGAGEANNGNSCRYRLVGAAQTCPKVIANETTFR